MERTGTDMTYGAYGLVEVVGEANAILVTDRIDSVKEDPPCEVIESAVISNPSQEMIDIVEMFRSRRK